MGKILLFKNDAEEKIISGAKKISEAVSITMGPRGKNVILGKFIGAPVITKDGVSVAREVVLRDPVENLVAQLIKEAAGRTADIAGDGTTTATVLTEEIIIRGKDLISDGYSPLDYRDSVDIGVKMISDNLTEIKKEIKSEEELFNIATISSNNDASLGKLISEAYSYAGLSGTVLAQAKPGAKSYVEKTMGLELKRGVVSTAFFSKDSKSSVSYENCYILLVNRDMTHFDDCVNLFSQIHNKNVPVLILAKSIKKAALATLVENNRLGKLRAVGVEIPNMSEDQIENISIMTGANIIGEDSGKPILNASLEDLGFAKKVYCDKYVTKIMEPSVNQEKRAEKISIYEDDLSKLLSESERRKADLKIRSLSGKAAMITVGYNTELELREKSDRIDDAIHATKAALEEGILPGGGVALLWASRNIDLSSVPENLRRGVQALAHACERPIRQIAENAGLNSDDIISQINKRNSKNYGYNVATGEYGDMLKMGVIDPYKVTKTAISNASSISLLLINTDGIISEDPDKPTGWQPPAGWRPPEEASLNHKY